MLTRSSMVLSFVMLSHGLEYMLRSMIPAALEATVESVVVAATAALRTQKEGAMIKAEAEVRVTVTAGAEASHLKENRPVEFVSAAGKSSPTTGGVKKPHIYRPGKVTNRFVVFSHLITSLPGIFFPDS